MFKKITVISHFEGLSKDDAGTRNMGATHEDNKSVSSSNESDVNFMAQAEDIFFKSPDRPFPFHFMSFNKRCHIFLQDLRQAHY